VHSLVLSPPAALDLSTHDATLKWARQWLAPWVTAAAD
jgi:hypothetical protein